MSINLNGEKNCNPSLKFNKLLRFASFLKKIFGFYPEIAISSLSAVFVILGSVHLGYGSSGVLPHGLNNNGPLNKSAAVSDARISDSANKDKGGADFWDYEIKSGDTIWSIAEKYNAAINAILEINGLTAESIIKPGQKLKLPLLDFKTRAVISDDNSIKNQENNLEDENRNENKPFDYEVEIGDTISNIAERYNLKINTILWANNLTTKSIIVPGQKLILLPVDGVLHKIKKGETIGQIALLYKADPQKTLDYNGIDDATKIYPGDMIIIPDGEPLPPPPPKLQISKPAKPPENIGDNQPPAESPALNPMDKLLWPTPATRITQGYWAKHRGIDIAGGTPPIFASHDGTVEFAGRSGDWGNTVLLRMEDGMVTRYSHASEIYVAVGQAVKTGDTIAKIGSTGRSTGNHLDFRVYISGVAVNPLKLLEKK